MREIELSTMFSVDPSSVLGDGFFDAFTKQHQINVKRQHFEWPDAWHQLVQFGLNSQGPDVSEIGTTWLGSFHTMEALRPLAVADTTPLGDMHDFPPALWQACQAYPSTALLGVPWTLDMRVVLYRRDLLQKAGVDEAKAFSDPAHFHDTLKCLQAAGHASPLGLTTFQTSTRLVHDMACWVWSAGGELRSQDGRRMLLMEATSRAGLRDYFSLGQFIPPETRGLTEEQVFAAFYGGKVAVAILPERSYLDVVQNKSGAAPEVVDQVGMARLMRTPYIGGSALAIWRYSSNYQDALKLIRELTSLETWQALSKQHHQFVPARMDALAQSALGSIPYYPVIQESLRNGRSFYSGFRWNAVEARLAIVIEQMWEAVRADPQLDVAREVEQRFSDLCDRMERTILASSI